MYRMIKSFTVIILLIIIHVVLYRTVMFNASDVLYEELEYALSSSCYDATSVMRLGLSDMSINRNLDGEMAVNKELALETFDEVMEMNLSKKFEYELPVRGVISDDGIQICRYDGTWNMKVNFEYFHEKTNSIYIFTLGDQLRVKYLSTGLSREYKFSDIASPYDAMTMEQFKNYVIMSTINREITKVLNSKDNMTLNRTGVGLIVNLEVFDQVEVDGKIEYNDQGNIVRDIGFFAVVDGYMRGFEGRTIRLANISGSELRERK